MRYQINMEAVCVLFVMWLLWLFSMWAFRHGWVTEVEIRDKRIAELEAELKRERCSL